MKVLPPLSSRDLLVHLLVFLFVSSSGAVDQGPNETVRPFPDQFFFGVSTSSFQIEGAWNVDGKGENIWDRYTHNRADRVVNQDNADVACDSYNLYNRDVEMLRELGVDYYRFSLSWSRLLPTGFTEEVNMAGVRYYNALIDALLEKNIIPLVTLFHWDLPQSIQELGGWTNPVTASYYADYANVAFRLFGDRVKHWITFNEPKNFCLGGYGVGSSAPGFNVSGIGEYMCAHTVLRAHAMTYRMYEKDFRPEQKGSIGITLDVTWGEPASSTKKDEHAAERQLQFCMGWFANPIFSENGDYPALMKNRIAKRSMQQGFSRSRLPQFTDSEIQALKGSADFFGLNHYTTTMVKSVAKEQPVTAEPSFMDDASFVPFFEDSWPSAASKWLKVVPWGLTKILNRIKTDYNNPEVIITENGYSTTGGLDDNNRISYHNQYLNALLDAIEDDSNVSGYTIWSLMDNFEWTEGYSEKFGLYQVDFNDPKRTRTPRDSAKYFANVIKTRSVKAFDSCIDCFDSNSVNYNVILT